MKRFMSLMIVFLLLANPLVIGFAEGVQAIGENVSVENVVSDGNGVEAQFDATVEVTGTVEAEGIGVSSTFGSEVVVGTEASALEETSTLEDVKEQESGEVVITSGETGIYVSHESSVLAAGDVVVKDEEDATGIQMYSDNGTNLDENYVYVAGDLDVTGATATGVDSFVDNNANNVIISGDVTVKAENEANGVISNAAGGLSETNVEIGGDLTVTGTEGLAIDAQTANVTVEGSVTSEVSGVSSRFGSTVVVGTDSETAQSVETPEDVKALETGKTAVTAENTGVYLSHESTTVIAGDVVVNDKEDATGVQMYIDENSVHENNVYIAGDVTVTGDNATGIDSDANKNTNNVIISGDLEVTADGNVTGIKSTATRNDSGTNVDIGGNVVVSGSNGIAIDAQTADVHVAGTVESNESGISSSFGSTVEVNVEDGAIESIESLEDLEKLESGKDAVTAEDTGVFLSHESEAMIGGNVRVEDTGDATGISLYSDEYARNGNTAYVAGDVIVNGYDATGIESEASKNTNDVMVSGNVIVTGVDTAVGVLTNPGDGEANIAIGGNVVANGADATAVDAGTANVVVEGTVTSSGTGVVSKFDSVVAVGVDSDTAESLKDVETVQDLDQVATGKVAVTAGETGIFSSHESIALIVGDVEVEKKTEGTATGISVYNDNYATGEEYVLVAGDVSVNTTATGEDVVAKGVHSNAIENGLNVTISGDLSVSANNQAGGVYAAGIQVNQDEDVSGGKTDIVIGGNVDVSAVSADSRAFADGIIITSDGSDDSVEVQGSVLTFTETNDSSDTLTGGVNAIVKGDGKISITVEDDVKVSTVGDKNNAFASGLYLAVLDGDIATNVGGDVSLTGTNVMSSAAIQIDNWDETDKGTATVTVEGNVESSSVGLLISTESDNVVSDILINGELKGDNVSVLVNDAINTENVNLTVYKVELNTIDGEEHAVAALNADNELVTNETTEAVEKAINYIIKVEANPNGNLVADKETAKEGEIVTMMISANAGYHVVAAYNGEGEQVPLLVDANGNYYVEVPRGGGIYLSARIDQDYVPADDGGDDDEPVVVRRETVAQEETATATVIDNTAVVETSIEIEEPIEIATELPAAAAEQLSGNETVAVVFANEVVLEESEKEVMADLNSEEQLAVVLSQAGLDEVVELLGLSVEDNVKTAIEAISTDLSSAIITAEMTVNGEKAEWQIVSVVKNGETIRYAFRQKADGTWEYVVLTDNMLADNQ